MTEAHAGDEAGTGLDSVSAARSATASSTPGDAAPAQSASTDPAGDAELQNIFGERGLLAAAVPGYRPRVSQQSMAGAVRGAIEGAETLIVEAGTGTGKTFAYLAPALLHGGKVIISTGTKTLQDQLFQRDIPTVREALNVPVTVALLKGRANYVCHYHLARAREGGRFGSRQDTVWLRAIELYTKTSRNGDKAGLAEVPENAGVWNHVTSTRDNCLGSECPNYKDCFVMQARREAQQADIVVVNHHLFFADLLLKDTGVTDLLPACNTIIFDEAHQLPEVATLFFGETFSTSRLFELGRDAVNEGLGHARGADDWVDLAAQLERAARDLRLTLGGEGRRDRSPSGAVAEGPPAVRMTATRIPTDSEFHPALERIRDALSHLRIALHAHEERHEDLAACARRADELEAVLENWVREEEEGAPDAAQSGDDEPASPHMVRWIEAYSSTVQLHRTPLEIAPIFTRHREDPPRAWIFTSAALAVKRSFGHYARQLGLDPEKSLVLDSPFDYAQQALLYVPRGLPQPSLPDFTDAAIDAALPLIEACGGGAFFLCTTLRAVNRTAERLRDAFATKGLERPLLVQGETGRTELLERFRALGNAVLIGSQSFWEGVDVRGEALSLVVIDKLPFAPPDDPVLAARLDALERQGKNPFMAYQLPMAAINLKQGAGRLIRSEFDRGVLMICDPRLVDKPYGRQIWQSLPPFRRTREREEALAFLVTLGEAAAGK
ncbi:MAG: ATP-dependent DNA helicase [Candidatus Protistobacter heckmanni]|nr:ATP-dependent DNA helicase [Candidatus Protistobacter heckmanni]